MTFLKSLWFRCFFIWAVLYINPISWVRYIPGFSWGYKYYHAFVSKVVIWFNTYFFHFADVSTTVNGSGDFGYEWARVSLILCISAVGGFLWSFLLKPNTSNHFLNYWLKILLRYYVAQVLIVYGIFKIMLLQMPFPDESILNTKVGELNPMKLAWIFFGYSAPYEIFTGIVELLAGVMLLFRKTKFAGLLLALLIFFNIFFLNIFYNVSQKILTIHLILFCLYLIYPNAKRLFAFIFQDKFIPVSKPYVPVITWRGMPNIKLLLQFLFVLGCVVYPTRKLFLFYQKTHAVVANNPIQNGKYKLTIFSKSVDSVSHLTIKDFEWQDAIFEKDGSGSFNTIDTMFTPYFGRGYFVYAPDSLNNSIIFKKTASSAVSIFSLAYKPIDALAFELSGKVRQADLQLHFEKDTSGYLLAPNTFSLFKKPKTKL